MIYSISNFRKLVIRIELSDKLNIHSVQKENNIVEIKSFELNAPLSLRALKVNQLIE